MRRNVLDLAAFRMGTYLASNCHCYDVRSSRFVSANTDFVDELGLSRVERVCEGCTNLAGAPSVDSNANAILGRYRLWNGHA